MWIFFASHRRKYHPSKIHGLRTCMLLIENWLCHTTVSYNCVYRTSSISMIAIIFSIVVEMFTGGVEIFIGTRILKSKSKFKIAH